MDNQTNSDRIADLWARWPQWDHAGKFRTPHFSFNASVTDYTQKTDADSVVILKDQQFLEIYRRILADGTSRNILEIGYFQGGMPLLLADMALPEKIVAVDWFPPTDAMLEQVTRNGFADLITFIGDIDQNKPELIRDILDAQFGDTMLDLIIDDCSHEYVATKACFETLFSYLRPGGKYIVEDWGWTHWPKEHWQSEKSHFHGTPSMSNLLFEILMVQASTEDLIAQVEVLSPSCYVVTRGLDVQARAPIDLASLTKLAGGRNALLITQPQVPTAIVPPAPRKKRRKTFWKKLLNW